jgi:hypothetical protein
MKDIWVGFKLGPFRHVVEREEDWEVYPIGLGCGIFDESHSRAVVHLWRLGKWDLEAKCECHLMSYIVSGYIQ